MSKEGFEKLGKAIVANAQWLDDLSNIDYLDSLEIDGKEMTKSLGFLKNSRIIFEKEEGFFEPGMNFELLRKALGAHDYEVSTTVDIKDWLRTYKHLIAEYTKSVGEAGEKYKEDLKKIAEHCRSLWLNFYGVIESIERSVDVSVNSGRDAESKTMLAEHQLKRTEEIIVRLGRLDFDSLFCVPNDGSDLYKIIIDLESKLDKLHSDFEAVLRKIQKLNLSFRKIIKRTKRLNQILTAIKNKDVILDIEAIDVENEFKDFHKVSGSKRGSIGHFNLTNPSPWEEEILSDTISKMSLKLLARNNKPAVKRDRVKHKKQEQKIVSNVLDEVINKQKKELAAYLWEVNDYVSLSDYYQNNNVIKEIMEKKMWLYKISTWLEKEKSIFYIDVDKEPVCRKSDVYEVSDVKVKINKDKVGNGA